MKLCGFLTFVLALFGAVSVAESWDYGDNGPNTWYRTYPDCALSGQSPINIDTSSVQYDTTLADLKFYEWATELPWNIYYNGFEITITPASNTEVAISAGSLGTLWALSSMRFHLAQGSEHLIDGNSYAAELQMLHISKFRTNTLLSFLFEIDSNDNTALAPLVSVIPTMSSSPSQSTATFSLSSLLLGTSDLASFKAAGYFRYLGSLSTPPCTEGRNWTIFRQTVKISYSQLYALTNGKNLVNNRPVQPRNYRIVSTNRPISGSPNSFVPSGSVLVFMGLVALAF